MKATKTLVWFQKHASDSAVRANIQTTVTNDDGSTVASSAEDVTITDTGVLSAAAALEETILASTGSIRPAPTVLPGSAPAEATPAAPVSA